MAFMAIIVGSGLLFCILLGFRVQPKFSKPVPSCTQTHTLITTKDDLCLSFEDPVLGFWGISGFRA